MDVIVKIFNIAGSLAVFLYGMKIMSDGIQKVAGERLQSILNFMTRNRFAAVLTGFLITSIIQSSSATTVMVVSFVNASLLSLTQAIGVIMGANIGTTVTGWIVSIFGFKFDITCIALPVVGIGFPFFFSKVPGRRDFGEVLVGFGLLFLGLMFLKNSVPPIKEHTEVFEFVRNFEDMGPVSLLLFVLLGTMVTVIVQSSSAAMAITIAMAFAGWIQFPSAAAIVLGENIGTTITAYLASLNTNVAARRAARAHFLFNVIGVVWMLVVFKWFIKLVYVIMPADPADAAQIPVHLSLFHTMFNLTNTFVFIWFIPLFARLVEKLVRPGKRDIQAAGYRLNYFKSPLQDTPELNIIEAKQEVSKMADVTGGMFDIFCEVFNNPDKKMRQLVERVKEMEELTDQMQEQISAYLAELARENLTEKSSQNVTSMLRITHELESIGDSCYNLMILAQRRYDKKYVLNKRALEEIGTFSGYVKAFIAFYREHLNRHLSSYDLDRAYELEDMIDSMRDKLKRNARKRLQSGSNVKPELLFIDIVRHFEQIGDYSLNISQALRQIR
ncbi:MAG: Na/Pi cotransporter family protein [Spirochaetales bacterium]|nr:Na/Pi cotransporter family protein [Spirochaetales bacterium]